MKYTYLTFDCYGTLIDWRGGIGSAFGSALGNGKLGQDELLKAYVSAEQKEEKTYKAYRSIMVDSLKSASKALGVAVTDEAAKAFAASLPDWPAFADSAEFLREMGRRGYKRYILSNVDDDLLGDTIDRSQLQVDGWVTAEEVRSYKPDERHWLEFMRRTGARKSEILHIAQSVYHDITPSQRLGIDSAWVNRYGESFPAGVSASIVSDSLSHLAELLP